MTQLQQYERPDETDDEFATPPSFVRDLARHLPTEGEKFDVDPASGAESVPLAHTRYTTEDDGLAQAWHGYVWLNPPWSSENGTGEEKERWLTKARNQAARDAVDAVVVLLPADTSRHWFHDHILEADVICLLGPGRMAFEGENRNPSFNLVCAVFGDAPDELTRALADYGGVLRECGGEFSSTRQSGLGEVPASAD